VRRKENKISDKLANFGVDLDGSDFRCDPSIHMDYPLVKECISLALSTKNSSDGVSGDR
jgi:hypothetical protein